jgi:hypothetical protein
MKAIVEIKTKDGIKILEKTTGGHDGMEIWIAKMLSSNPNAIIGYIDDGTFASTNLKLLCE